MKRLITYRGRTQNLAAWAKEIGIGRHALWKRLATGWPLEQALLGASEWLFGALLFLGFWNKRLGILGAIGSTLTFLGTVTIIPFMPNGWDPVAGFPAMAGNVPFLMKDIVLLAVSIYLLKQDVVRVLEAGRSTSVASSQT